MVFNFPLLILTVAAALILCACTVSRWKGPIPPRIGDWPYDRNGVYHEAYADARHPDADNYWQEFDAAHAFAGGFSRTLMDK